MACSETRRIANQDWPLFQTTDSGLCCYKVVVATRDAAATVGVDAESQPDYAERSPFYEVPEGIQFYVCFKQAGA